MRFRTLRADSHHAKARALNVAVQGAAKTTSPFTAERVERLDRRKVLFRLGLTLAATEPRAELTRAKPTKSVEARLRNYFETTHIGSVGRNRSLIPVRVAAGLAAFDRAHADLAAALNRFGVRYLGLRRGTRPPYLRQGWAIVSSGPTWEVWERIANPRP